MPDPEIIIEVIDNARKGLNRARNAAEQWLEGKVAGVNFTAAQRTAIRTAFMNGLQEGKDGITAVDDELLN